MVKYMAFFTAFFLSLSNANATISPDWGVIPAETISIQGCKLYSNWGMQFYGSSATAATKGACASIVYGNATTEEHHIANKYEQWSLNIVGDRYSVKYYQPSTNRWHDYEISFYDAGTDLHCPDSDYPTLVLGECYSKGRICDDGYYANEAGSLVNFFACDRKTPVISDFDCVMGIEKPAPDWPRCLGEKPDEEECEEVYIEGVKKCLKDASDVCETDEAGDEICADGCGHVTGIMPDGSLNDVYFCADPSPKPEKPIPDAGTDDPDSDATDDNGDGEIDSNEKANAALKSINERIAETNKILSGETDESQDLAQKTNDLLADILKKEGSETEKPSYTLPVSIDDPFADVLTTEKVAVVTKEIKAKQDELKTVIDDMENLFGFGNLAIADSGYVANIVEIKGVKVDLGASRLEAFSTEYGLKHILWFIVGVSGFFIVMGVKS